MRDTLASARLEGMDTHPSAPVSEADREHFRQIGEWKQRSHDEARAAHMALPPYERLERSMRMSRMYMKPGQDPWEDGTDEPWKFIERAKQLGLFRG